MQATATNILLGERTLTELDHQRLSRLVDKSAPPALEALLDATDIVGSREVAANVVTMYSQVRIVDASTGQPHTLTLCYPADAEPAAGFISVLSPVGLALIGLRVGALARWRVPGGEEGCARLEQILFQPEASGDYTT
ncbi:GreA/GreB family elongation factor [Variovorax sp. JS1663]|uniref:GreA/GreB family elongation factor n=1 Tax=Variovorax sp. JS1663 TaxID=1851577 RepID=UPI000B344BFA|nr:GreA/GreB family elongation factor [Variovorax sp. JS1663]OUL98676.1 transcription elongation factor GreAB [Variovorax sp. JS1663]